MVGGDNHFGRRCFISEPQGEHKVIATNETGNDNQHPNQPSASCSVQNKSNTSEIEWSYVGKIMRTDADYLMRLFPFL